VVDPVDAVFGEIQLSSGHLPADVSN